MSSFGGYNKDEHLAKLRGLLRNEIKRLSWVFAEHFRDNWFSSVGDKLDWAVPMPYEGQLIFKKVSREPAKFLLSLQKNSSGKCNFPRHEVISLADSIGREISVQVSPDFSTLADGYTGELSDVMAFRRRPDLYGPHI